MSKEHYFIIESNLTRDFHFGIEVKDDWILYFENYMYQDDVQKLVKEWKKPIYEDSDMDDFTIWLHNKKGIHCWVIPKIYYIKNNSLRFLKASLTNFIRNERKLGSNEQSLKLAIRNIVKECLNK